MFLHTAVLSLVTVNQNSVNIAGKKKGNKGEKKIKCKTQSHKLKSVTCLNSEHKYQAFDNFKQLLHHNSNALVTKETADGLEVRRANKVPVRAIYVGVGNVQRLKRKEDTESCSSGRRQESLVNI